MPGSRLTQYCVKFNTTVSLEYYYYNSSRLTVEVLLARVIQSS